VSLQYGYFFQLKQLFSLFKIQELQEFWRQLKISMEIYLLVADIKWLLDHGYNAEETEEVMRSY
jgi:hypothetical protein